MSESRCVQTVTIEWTEPTGIALSQLATIATLDRTTTRLEVAEAVHYGQSCVLAFGGNAGEKVRATVRDVRPKPGDGYRVACQFEAPLSDKVLDALSDNGSFNRRAHERRPVSLEIRATPELTQGQGQFAVQIVDLSPGGCCLKSPQQVPAGYRIRLSADCDAENTTAIPLRVQWQKPADHEVLVGCSFCHASGYALLAAQAFEQPAPGASTSPRLLNRMFYLALGAVGLTAATTQA